MLNILKNILPNVIYKYNLDLNMEYLSTRNSKLRKSFTEVIFQGLSREGGLFLPTEWPTINTEILRDKSYQEVALNIISPYIGDEISDEDLYEIIVKSYSKFSNPKIAPLVEIDSNKHILELFYGPTLAFKDYAMQFLGNLFSYKMQNKQNKITILGATSGDTGSAAIEAFKGKDNINVFILHPHNRVSQVQRLQMSTVLDSNIFNLAIEGTFDDCQKIVKDLFIDDEIQNKTSLTSVNSINWSRLIAQVVYYYWAYLQLEEEFVSFIVPSGNFGNIFSARIAQQMGLPIKNLHIATNQNDILNKIISSGQMVISKVQETFSPSMDIQISSNFERQIFYSVNQNSEEVQKIMNEFNQNGKYFFGEEILKNLKNTYRSSSVSNIETIETIREIKKKYNYIVDPHTATGLSVLNKINPDHSYISLGCAHPAKFAGAIEKAIDMKPQYPDQIKNIFDKKEKITILPNDTRKIKSHILQKI